MSLISQYPYLEKRLNHILDIYNQYIVPRLTKKNKAIAISTAVALSLYIIVDKYIKPPRKLRHIPYQSYYEFLKTILYKETYDTRAKNFYLPTINSPSNNGIYMTADRFGWVIHVANPHDAKTILMKYERFPKSDQMHGVETTLFARYAPQNLVFINGARWKSQRMLANPAFRRSMPVKLFGNLALELFKSMDTMDGNIEITDLMERFTLDAIGNAGFGFNFKAISEKDNDWINTYNTVNKGLTDPLYFFMPIFDTTFRWLFPKRQAVHRELDRFHKMLDNVIAQKRQEIANGADQKDTYDENEKDLLSLLIQAEAKGEGVMSDQELKSNLAVFFLAGHDTTANTLGFAFYHLAKNPDIQQRAREEVLSILGDEPEDKIPSVDQTKEMTYLNQVIKETLRINGPAAQVFPRIAEEDTVLSGTFIPKGTRVVVDIYNIQHSDKNWKDSFVFNPDRFGDNGEYSQHHESLSWVPFGSGPRQCIAMNFSLAEQRVLLSMFLKKYTWSLPENSPHKDRVILKGITVIAPDHLELSFKKRY